MLVHTVILLAVGQCVEDNYYPAAIFGRAESWHDPLHNTIGNRIYRLAGTAAREVQSSPG